MTFSARDLRPGKDVFDPDGKYLGTVVWVVSKPADPLPLSRGRDVGARQSSHRPADDVAADESYAQRRGPGGEGPPPGFSGEAVGPMPTESLGNSGPRRQSRATAYATTTAHDTHGRHPAELVVVRLLTALNWSTLRPRISRVPVSLVQAVSHERIVLAVSPHHGALS